MKYGAQGGERRRVKIRRRGRAKSRRGVPREGPASGLHTPIAKGRNMRKSEAQGGSSVKVAYAYSAGQKYEEI